MLPPPALNGHRKNRISSKQFSELFPCRPFTSSMENKVFSFELSPAYACENNAKRRSYTVASRLRLVASDVKLDCRTAHFEALRMSQIPAHRIRVLERPSLGCPILFECFPRLCDKHDSSNCFKWFLHNPPKRASPLNRILRRGC